MNRPDPRLVPTLTEVLDDAHWQSAGAREPAVEPAALPKSEPAASESPPVLQPVGLALLESLPSLDLPDLGDPVLDLSEEALALHAQEEASPDLPESPDLPASVAESSGTAETLDQSPALEATSPAAELAFEDALRTALLALGPRLAETLAPLLVEQLGPQFEALVEARVERALRLGRPDFPHGESD